MESSKISPPDLKQLEVPWTLQGPKDWCKPALLTWRKKTVISLSPIRNFALKETVSLLNLQNIVQFLHLKCCKVQIDWLNLNGNGGIEYSTQNLGQHHPCPEPLSHKFNPNISRLELQTMSQIHRNLSFFPSMIRIAWIESKHRYKRSSSSPVQGQSHQS